jgi:hypothetical protein
LTVPSQLPSEEAYSCPLVTHTKPSRNKFFHRCGFCELPGVFDYCCASFSTTRPPHTTSPIYTTPHHTMDRSGLVLITGQAKDRAEVARKAFQRLPVFTPLTKSELHRGESLREILHYHGLAACHMITIHDAFEKAQADGTSTAELEGYMQFVAMHTSDLIKVLQVINPMFGLPHDHGMESWRFYWLPWAGSRTGTKAYPRRRW